MRDHTAGDPMDEKIRWTDLTPREIMTALREDHGIRVSQWVVRQLLQKHDYRRRKAQKKTTMKEAIPHRNEQFENIARLTAEYQAAGNPILSMDTKKKSTWTTFIGQDSCIRWKLCWSTIMTSPAVLPASSSRIVFMTKSRISVPFRSAPAMTPVILGVIACAIGGTTTDNPTSPSFLFKRDLQALADEIGVEIRSAHYPPYCSKYNPIEHRLFPHVTRTCQGVVFATIELVKELMEKTHTKTGLKAFVHIIDKVYQIGRKVPEEFKKTMRIVFDEILPKWNYRAVPLSQSCG
jgi:hypothetical protein